MPVNIPNDNEDFKSRFGFGGLSLDETGGKLAVGDPRYNPRAPAAPEEYQVNQIPIGTVLVYADASTTTPSLTETIVPPLTQTGQNFGFDVALTPDGTKLAVGARQYGDPLDDLAPWILFTDASGSVVGIEIRDQNNNVTNLSSRGYPPSGTFSTSVATEASTTPATFSYTSTDGIIAASAITITNPGSGFTPSTTIPLAYEDRPQRITEQRFWADYQGETKNTKLERNNQGQIYLYTDDGITGLTKTAQVETLNWLSDQEAPILGITVDITADGNTVVAGGPNEGYHSLYRPNFSPGMAVVADFVPPPPAPSQFVSYVSSVSPYYLPEGQPGGIIPPVSPAGDYYGIIHKMSADGSTLVASRGTEPAVDVWVTANGGETWTLDRTIPIVHSTPGDVYAIITLDIDETASKFVVLYSHKDVLTLHPLEQQPPYFVVTFYKDGGEWLPQTVPMNADILPAHTAVSLSGDGMRLALVQQRRLPILSFNTATNVNATSNRVTNFSNAYMEYQVRYSNVQPVIGSSGRYIAGVEGTDNIGLTPGNYYWAHRMTSLQATFHASVDDLRNDNIGPPVFYGSGTAAENPIDLSAGTGETHCFAPTEHSTFPRTCYVSFWNWDNIDKVWSIDISAQTDSGRYIQQTKEFMVDPEYYTGNSVYDRSGVGITYQWGCGLAQPTNGAVLAVSSATRVEEEVYNFPLVGYRTRELTLFNLQSQVEGPDQWTPFLELFNGPYSLRHDPSVPFESQTFIQFSGDGTKALFIDRILNHAYVLEADDFTTGAYVWKQLITSDTPLIDTGFGGTSENGVPQGGAISKDGTTIALGAWKESGGEGGLYIFRRVNEQWRQEQHVDSPCPQPSGAFGACVSVNENGSLVSVSAPDLTGQTPGQINIFTLTGPSGATSCPAPLTESAPTHQYLLKNVVNVNDIDEYNLGTSIAITPDAERIVIGGSEVRVFVNNGLGGWELEQSLVPTELPTAFDRSGVFYGTAVAINDAGDRIIVTATEATVGATLYVGQAYIFDRSGSVWTQTATLAPAYYEEGWQFGSAVAMNPSGNVVAISRSGGGGLVNQAYVFRNTTGTTWIETPIATGDDAIEPRTYTIDYVDNGTNKGLVAFISICYDGISDSCKLYVYGHDYGAPDTVTAGYTYVWPNTFSLGAQHSLKFSKNKGEYLFAAELSLNQVYVLKNTNLVGSDRDPNGPWTLVTTIEPNADLSRISGTLSNAFFPNVHFGTSIDVTPNLDVLVSSVDYTWNNSRPELFFGGSAWVYTKQVGDTWALDPTRRIFPSSANAQLLGTCVVTSDDLNSVVFGGPRKYYIDGIQDRQQGQAQTYKRVLVDNSATDSWAVIDTLEDTDGVHTGTYYGEGSHALSKDGSTIAACYQSSDNGIDYIDFYTHSAGVVALQERVRITGLEADVFSSGLRLQLSNDGNKLVAADANANLVVTLTRVGSNWTELPSTLDPTDILSPGSMLLSGDGNTLFLSVSYASPLGNTQRIAIYNWNSGTSAWDLEDNTIADGSNSNIADSYTDMNSIPVASYGNGMSCSSNGNWLVVTGERYCVSSATEGFSPCAYVYQRTISPTAWTLQAIVPLFQASQLTQPTGAILNCKMTADGQAFVVSSSASSRLWVVTKDPDTNHWNTESLAPKDENGEIMEELGAVWALDVTDNADYIFAGTNEGNRVIVWRRVSSGWRQETIINPPTGTPSARPNFGTSLSISSDASLVTISDNRNITDNSYGGVLFVLAKN